MVGNKKVKKAFLNLSHDFSVEDEIESLRKNKIPRLTNSGDPEGDVYFEVSKKRSLSTPADILGEESIVDGTSYPDSDDDTLKNAQMMGQQLEEDSEHPEELDIARDMNQAEEYLRTH